MKWVHKVREQFLCEQNGWHIWLNLVEIEGKYYVVVEWHGRRPYDIRVYTLFGPTTDYKEAEGFWWLIYQFLRLWERGEIEFDIGPDEVIEAYRDLRRIYGGKEWVV